VPRVPGLWRADWSCSYATAPSKPLFDLFVG
jgi:hypothetical protein